jgi:hypothetical protein
MLEVAVKNDATTDPIEVLRREAKTAFVGHGPVIGVGIVDYPGESLVFLMQEESPTAEREIIEWAQVHSITVQFIVTGQIRGLSRI